MRGADRPFCRPCSCRRTGRSSRRDACPRASLQIIPEYIAIEDARYRFDVAQAVAQAAQAEADRVRAEAAEAVRIAEAAAEAVRIAEAAAAEAVRVAETAKAEVTRQLMLHSQLVAALRDRARTAATAARAGVARNTLVVLQYPVNEYADGAIATRGTRTALLFDVPLDPRGDQYDLYEADGHRVCVWHVKGVPRAGVEGLFDDLGFAAVRVIVPA